MQPPLHGFVSPTHIHSHFPEPLSHLPTCPAFIGQSVSLQQSTSGMHFPPHSLLPDAQMVLQRCVLSSQVATAPGRAGQSSLVQQSPHWSPQRFFAPQVKSHLDPSHVAIAPAGATQGAQEDGPQELTLVFSAQTPLQSCVRSGQEPVQGAASSMHSPRHSFLPAGQVPPHLVPSQIAVPPLISGHGWQETPQLPISLSPRQVLPQRWVPAPHPGPPPEVGAEPESPGIPSGASRRAPPEPSAPPSVVSAASGRSRFSFEQAHNITSESADARPRVICMFSLSSD
jgi:hypothetical protein